MKEIRLIITNDGFKHWKLEQDLKVNTSQGVVIIPKGFRTDGASIPKIFWPIIGHPFSGDFAVAAVVHDYLYTFQHGTRKDADQIFKELMIRYGTYKWKVKLMYPSVRIFGRICWVKKW